MANKEVLKLILKERVDLLFWVMLLFNCVTTFVTPAVDWYAPYKLVLLLWLCSGAWLLLPLASRLRQEGTSWGLAVLALLVGTVYLLPLSWPLKVEYPLLEGWFLLTVPLILCNVWRHFGWREMLQPQGLLWTLWPVLLLGGAVWCVEDPDLGSLGAALLQQVFYLLLGCHYAACGVTYRKRWLFTLGLLLVTLGFWACVVSYSFVLPFYAYYLLWALGFLVLELVFPLMKPGEGDRR
ncbi:hypothetical protein LQE88_07830 [Acidaminococcus sp. NSJ-142]|jgi:hypothetical protein|uniref:hypothetical protein n=1 Tax=Acidaminococcus TaxID=904 RepID=UPI000CFA67F0|nr:MULTISPECIES: hypothetical protein [Acidaminococcus]MCD2435892.1 hypothetical protein [Acidaminococcus hominis]MCH4096116.1 hypothetical protein [Acidaminococcus provencensis]RHK01187.1 hypothetical protein DW089_07830 [Acidaminococcus sp. AM05-11]